MLTPNTFSILLVEDHRIFREMCRSVLSQAGFHVCGEAKDGLEAIQLATFLRPGIILMDIHMKTISGFEACREIKKIVPGVKVIFLSMYALPAYVKKTKDCGGHGYLSKGASVEELVEAITRVKAGEPFVSSQIENEQPVLPEPGSDVQVEYQLTKREIEIIELVKKGYSSKRIAETLFVSQHTVEMHRHNIFKKLKVANVASLIQFASDNCL